MSKNDKKADYKNNNRSCGNVNYEEKYIEITNSCISERVDQDSENPDDTVIPSDWRRSRHTASGRVFDLGALSPAVLDALAARGISVRSRRVTITRNRHDHAMRQSKRACGGALDRADMDRLPEIIARTDSVLVDENEDSPTLILVFSPVTAAREMGKIVVRVNFAERHRGVTTLSNAVLTAGYVTRHNLREPRYLCFVPKWNKARG